MSRAIGQSLTNARRCVVRMTVADLTRQSRVTAFICLFACCCDQARLGKVHVRRAVSGMVVGIRSSSRACAGESRLLAAVRPLHAAACSHPWPRSAGGLPPAGARRWTILRRFTGRPPGGVGVHPNLRRSHGAQAVGECWLLSVG